MGQMTLALVIGYVLDLIVGDPHNLWHPVCGIGKLISVTEKGLRNCFGTGKRQERLAGVVLVLVVCSVSTLVPLGIILFAGWIHPYLQTAVMAVMCCQLLATKSLKDESMKVYQALENKDLEGARTAVSMIVGRDTENLTEEGVAKAAVETVAENTSDGIIAPMIFMALFGAVGGFFYKSVNTMDSMVGYKNEKYLYLGRCAARLDDVLNYIPARLSAWLMISATAFTGLDGEMARKIYLRDRYNHARRIYFDRRKQNTAYENLGRE